MVDQILYFRAFYPIILSKSLREDRNHNANDIIMKLGSSEDSDCSLVHVCADGGSPLAPGFLIKLRKKKTNWSFKDV